ncbi:MULTISPECIES: ABC transporter ATP-binding protein [unclassified Coleofasciculus]|uniref:ABC transporter ATP-binding protein n=1 Tax=unclassified Coleofasciculus TaxID=2692782 RepID=UPI0018830F15|nr:MULTISPECIES: ABC transporter ATP-binding protein [unclassified Coleofasciculus]MBE9124812.1 ABC transporter ATP-binding protein [Coleofasciculus sp. LEGE 07081]MBE9147717.1 ABC transporter ATP-binding protein [Coleofasciculus sp. LEGE 07092]
MAKLELENLRKQFGPKIVPVKDISLDVEDGEFLTFVGPSGCGKSTTLRMIAGLDQPSHGKVLIGGHNVNPIPPGKRNIAMVFQSYALYPHMTVAENIAASLKLRKTPKDEIKRRVNEVSHKLGLEHLLDRKPGKLSGGQRQRVALARALVREPDVFLLDEPLSNLDALLREQVRAELKQLFESQNKPVVYVTHDQTEAMTLSTKIAVLYDGVLQQLDPPHRIYSRPANQFVAGFMGSPQMNLLTLNCQGNCAVLGDFKINLPELSTVPSQIVLGIRPEDVRLDTSDDFQTIQGQVYLQEDLGKEKLISVRVDGSDQAVRALLPADQHWEGEAITLAISAKATHWFDVNSGDRLGNH